MTFKQAQKKLAKIADGRYHTIRYELTEHHDGEQIARCSVYVNDMGWHDGATWQGAFNSLEKTPPDTEEAP